MSPAAVPAPSAPLLHRVWARLGGAPVWQKLAGLIVLPVVVVLAAGSVGTALEHGSALGMAAVVGVASLVGIALSAALGYALTRPLRSLTEAMLRIQSGDITARVRVWAPDEIGALQETFNRVADTLERSRTDLLARNRELSLLNRVASELAADPDPEAAVRALLPVLADTFDAAEATVYWPDSDSVTVSGTSGRRELAWADIASTPVEHVLLTGTAVALAGVSRLPGTSRGGELCWLAAPLRAHDTPLGAVAVARPGPPFTGADRALLDAVGSVAGVGIHNSRLLADLEESERRLRRAFARAVEGQEEERRRLARELHDGTSQALTSMLLRIATLERETDPDIVADRLTGLRSLTSLTLAEVRRLSTDLRPVMLDDLGLSAALRGLAERMAADSGIEVSLAVPPLDPLEPAVETTLYRSVQESLTNAVRHSGARRVDISLVPFPTLLRLTVADDGCGFEPATAGPGFGLVGMRERAEIIGGCLTVRGVRGAGTTVVLDIPREGP